MDVAFAWDIMHASDAYSRSDTAAMSAEVSSTHKLERQVMKPQCATSASGDPGTAEFTRVKNPLGNEQEWLCRTCAWIPHQEKGGGLFVRGELDVDAAQQSPSCHAKEYCSVVGGETWEPAPRTTR